ncbi:MAG: FAD-binding monooxygenase [Actinomycetota bacterium]|nr:FAD-binding monooxygenase [Actinomycetota bacterium]
MRKVGDHAVVIGASMAGLLTARVLTEAYERVTVVERDVLPACGEHRRGVPQAHHLHVLLASGLAALETLFDGFAEEMMMAGGLVGDVQADARLYLDGHHYRQVSCGLYVLTTSRPLLEGHLRQRVRALPTVEVLDGCDAAGLEVSADGRRVTGLRVLPRTDGAAAQTLNADLVVDASGRGSRTPVWLEQLGYSRPARDEVRVGFGYTSRLYRLDPDVLGGEGARISNGTLPHRYVGGLQLLEHGQMLATLGGYESNHPPVDPEGFIAFAAHLPADLYEIIQQAEPLSDPIRFTFPVSARNRYERLRRFPDGLLVLGDAIGSFTPTYGQGMSVAALEAHALRDCLRGGTRRLAARFFRAAARIVDRAWDISVISDLQMPEVMGRRTLKARLVNAYLPHVHAAATVDARVGAAFIRVFNLLDPPPRLLKPTLVLRVLRATLRRRRDVHTALDRPVMASQEGYSKFPAGDVRAESL